MRRIKTPGCGTGRPAVSRLAALFSLGILSLLVLGMIYASRRTSAHGDTGRAQEEGRSRREELARNGDGIVAAVYEFKNRCGLWPCTMAELVPDYVSADAARGWRYEWRASGRWHLTHFVAPSETAVRYEHRADYEGWQITDGVNGSNLGVAPPARPATPPSREELLRSMNAVMRRRIAADPKQLTHHQGLVCWLFRRGEFAEARAACARTLEVWPEHWWPNLMLALIDARLGAAAQSEGRLVRLAQKRADFNHAFFLAYFYAATNRTDEAMETLRGAAVLPLRKLDADWVNTGQQLGVMPTWHPWVAALMALRAKRYDVALAVCDRWERYWK